METDIVDVSEDILVPETEDCPAKFLKRACSLSVIGCRSVVRVLKPVQFDNDLMRGASEINDISGDRQLASERHAVKAVSADGVPELQFCVGHGLSHLPGIRAVF